MMFLTTKGKNKTLFKDDMCFDGNLRQDDPIVLTATVVLFPILIKMSSFP